MPFLVRISDTISVILVRISGSYSPAVRISAALPLHNMVHHSHAPQPGTAPATEGSVEHIALG